MSFTHARLQQLIHDYTDGEVALHEMTEDEQGARGWFAPFFILNGVSDGVAEAANMPSFFFKPAPFPPFNIENCCYLVDVQSQAYVFEDVEHVRRSAKIRNTGSSTCACPRWADSCARFGDRGHSSLRHLDHRRRAS